MNADDINSAVTHGNIELEKVLRNLATNAGGGLEPMTGNTYVCVKTTNSNYTDYVRKYQTIYKNGTERIQTDFSAALALLGPYDTIILSPGDWSGDHVGPLNAVAPFCRIFGMIGAWMAPSSASTPALDVKARGWEIAGIEFDASATACGLRMYKDDTGAISRGSDFFNVHDNLFYGGQGGIDFRGGGTYWKIRNNRFSLATDSGKAGIYVSNSSFQVPALGLIRDNSFDSNVNHIHAGGRGLADTEIRGNNFIAEGNGVTSTVLMDIRGGSGGNSVLDNYWDLAKGDFNAAATLVRANGSDFGAGNHFKDGDQTDPLGA